MIVASSGILVLVDPEHLNEFSNDSSLIIEISSKFVFVKSGKRFLFAVGTNSSRGVPDRFHSNSTVSVKSEVPFLIVTFVFPSITGTNDPKA